MLVIVDDINGKQHTSVCDEVMVRQEGNESCEKLFCMSNENGGKRVTCYILNNVVSYDVFMKGDGINEI